MDKNSIIGLVVIGVILVTFTIWNTPDKKQLREAQQKADSIALVQQRDRQEKLLQQQKNVQPVINETEVKNNKTVHLKYLADNYGTFANAAEGKNEFYTLENDLFKIKISSKGGRPYSVELKKYKTFDKRPLILFNGDSTIFGLNFYTQNNRIVSTNDLFFQPTGKDTALSIYDNDTSKEFALRLFAGNNQYIEYVYKLKPKSYVVDFNINLVNMDSVISSNSSSIDLNWRFNLICQEMVKKNEANYSAIYYKYFQDEVEKINLSSKDSIKIDNARNRIKWIAYKQQFFSSVLIAGNYFENATFKSIRNSDTTSNLSIFHSEIGIPYEKKPKENISLSFYFGPNSYQILKKFNLDLEELVNLGAWIIKWINRFIIIPVFNFLNGYISSYGIIILLLTIFIKIILFPLSYKSYLSMAKMRVLKPEIDEINARIPQEKAMERQQAVMALYKKVGVNPLGGCLPMLLQMPILIAMFRFFPTSIELRQQGFLWAHDLSSYDSIYSWNTFIPLITPYFGNHISLFNLLMTVTTIVTIHMSNQANASGQQMPGMKGMSYIMPVMFMFVLNNFSAGLTYYYFLVNIITIVQNEIFRRSIDEAKLLRQLNDNKKKPVKKSKFQERLEVAAKQRGYKMKR